MRSIRPELQKPGDSDLSPPDLSPMWRVSSEKVFSDKRRHTIFFHSRKTQNGRLYFDATDDFPDKSLDDMIREIASMSSCGYIHLETVKDHIGPEMARAFAAAYAFSSKSREVPTWAILDN